MEKNRIKICGTKNCFLLYNLLWQKNLAASSQQSNRSLIIYENVWMYKEIYWLPWVYAVKCNSANLTTKRNADWQHGYLSRAVVVSSVWPRHMLIWFFSHMVALLEILQIFLYHSTQLACFVVACHSRSFPSVNLLDSIAGYRCSLVNEECHIKLTIG